MNIYILSNVTNNYVKLHTIHDGIVYYYSRYNKRHDHPIPFIADRSDITLEHLHDIQRAIKEDDKETLTYYSLVYTKQ